MSERIKRFPFSFSDAWFCQ